MIAWDRRGACVAAAVLAAWPAAEVAHGAKLRLEKKIAAGTWPKAIVTTADGERAFVALHVAQQIAVIERDTLSVVARFDVGGRPESLALSPDQGRLYVSVSDRALVEVRSSVAPYALVRSIAVPARPRGIALDRTGRHLYVACARVGRLAIVDTSAGRVVGEVDVGWSPRTVAYVPKTGHVLVVHDVGNSLYVIDPRAMKVLHRIKGFGRRPLDVAVTADGQTAFVPSSKKGRVFRVDLVAGRVIDARAVGKGPVSVALAASRKLLLVGLWDEKRIALVSTGKGRGRPKKIKTCREPSALHLSRSGKTLYAVCPRSHAVWAYSIH